MASIPHPNRRRPLRLRDHDYARAGAYFVTACAAGRRCLFGEVVEGETRLSAWGEIARACWNEIPDHFSGVSVDAFVVMPNHVHGIILINNSAAFGKPVAGSLATIIGAFKSVVTRRINQQRGTPGAAVWQRNYFERVIWDEAGLDRARDYIAANPARCTRDPENTERTAFYPLHQGAQCA